MSACRWRAALIGAAIAAALGLAASAGAAEYEWKCQSFWQPGTVNQQAFERFAANVAEKSGGRIAIEALPVDAVVPPGEMLDAVTRQHHPVHERRHRLLRHQGPGVRAARRLQRRLRESRAAERLVLQGGGVDIARDLYAQYGTYYLGPVLWGAESIPSKMPLRNIKDFEGVKMRSPEGMGAAIWRKLGVGVSTLPGTEVYTALERGKVEATDWGTLGMNDELGYDDIAPYAIYPGVHSMPASDVDDQSRVWNGLPDDLKQVLQEATRRVQPGQHCRPIGSSTRASSPSAIPRPWSTGVPRNGASCARSRRKSGRSGPRKARWRSASTTAMSPT